MSGHSGTTSGHEANKRIGLGIALMLIGTGVFVSMDALVKHLTLSGYSTIQILFFRSLFAFVPVSLFISMNGGFSTLKTKRPLGHVMRAAIGLSAMGVIFWAFHTLPISEIVAIMFAAPIFMTVLSIPLLGERVGIRRWIAVIVGFSGVLVIVRPDAGLDMTQLIVIGGTVLYALAMILVRRLSDTEPSATIVFFFTVAGTLMMAVLLPFGWSTPGSALDWGLLIAVGLVGGSAQLLITYAIRSAPISVLAPFEYSALLWATGFDILIFGLYPSSGTLWGAGIIAATGLYIVHRETTLGTRQKTGVRLARTRVASAERPEQSS
ncbi:MAG: DMT family transporter [Rhodospirillales bacterium]